MNEIILFIDILTKHTIMSKRTHPYLKYLLKDIQAGHRKPEDEPVDNEPTSLEDHFRDIENWLAGTTEESITYYTGLQKEDFPPAEQFSESEMKTVLHAFDRMLASWRTDIYYPEKMPIRERYKFLINTVLDDKISLISSGRLSLDYCTGNPEGCEWGEYCFCLDSDFYE